MWVGVPDLINRAKFGYPSNSIDYYQTLIIIGRGGIKLRMVEFSIVLQERIADYNTRPIALLCYRDIAPSHSSMLLVLPTTMGRIPLQNCC